jgi:hypothetical protein
MRKEPPINNLKKEMQRNMDIIDRLGQKTSKLDLKERSYKEISNMNSKINK